MNMFVSSISLTLRQILSIFFISHRKYSSFIQTKSLVSFSTCSLTEKHTHTRTHTHTLISLPSHKLFLTHILVLYHPILAQALTLSTSQPHFLYFLSVSSPQTVFLMCIFADSTIHFSPLRIAEQPSLASRCPVFLTGKKLYTGQYPFQSQESTHVTSWHVSMSLS